MNANPPLNQPAVPSARLRAYRGGAAIALYAAAIAAANYATGRFGLVPVAPGLSATAGTYAAGAALMLRNTVQDTLGRRAVLGAILLGAALSALTSPALALASGAAFGVSELADTGVYTPLRQRGWARAVLCASTLGALCDTLLFLSLAGFPFTARSVAGQLTGKAWLIWAPTLALALIRGRRRALPRHPLGA